MARARFAEILRLLEAGDVEFVVVAMTAGILQGAPVTTVDLDVVHRRSPANVARLLRVLGELDAVYRHRCLWFLRHDYYPATTEEAQRVLDAIRRHGDRDGFRRAARIRQWLSLPSSATSAGS